MAEEDSAFVRELLRHKVADDADDLDPSNDLEYLLGLVGGSLDDFMRSFDDDRERARWVIAQWCHEVGYQPDLSEYAAGETIPKGTAPPCFDGYQQTIQESSAGGEQR